MLGKGEILKGGRQQSLPGQRVDIFEKNLWVKRITKFAYNKKRFELQGWKDLFSLELEAEEYFRDAVMLNFLTNNNQQFDTTFKREKLNN